MPTKRRLTTIAIQSAVGLLCLRGFLAGHNPPAFAQDVPRVSVPSISPVDDLQDFKITQNTVSIAKIWERVNKQDDRDRATDLELAKINAKLEAQANFWSMQNGGVGLGVLAMLGFQVHPLIKARKRRSGDDDDE